MIVFETEVVLSQSRGAITGPNVGDLRFHIELKGSI